MVQSPRAAALLLSTLSACTPLVAVPPPSDRPVERIVFLGDSLVRRSDSDHGLLALVQKHLGERHPDRTFQLIDAGVDGDKIADIRRRLGKDVLSHHPHAVFLYWDSDVSDVGESGLPPDEVRALRRAYEDDLAGVLATLLAAGAYVIMSGPTLIGERPQGRNEKDAQLDTYRDINRRVAARLDVRYLDLRRRFQSYADRHRPSEPGHVGALTEDGEHLSALGVSLLSHEVVHALEPWLRRHRPDRVSRVREAYQGRVANA